MTFARSEILSEKEEIYHCISRCVRRAYLCGYDVVTGKNFDHRKGWVKKRLEFLQGIFTIDVLAYALMSTHQHLMLRTRPDLLESLTDEEVVRRWLKLYPVIKVDSDTSEETDVRDYLKNKPRVEVIRKRLGNISWYMKSVNEYIARQANKEDNCKGRFWEGRFKCQRLEDESAVLTCAMYIDLNPIRADVAKTPEESLYTSVHERIQAYLNKKNIWLSPLEDTKLKKGFLSIDFPTYLELLEETGKEIVKGKRGFIPHHLAPILTRLGIIHENWLNTVQHYGKWFSRIAGGYDSLVSAAKDLNRCWVKGMGPAKGAFV